MGSGQWKQRGDRDNTSRLGDDCGLESPRMCSACVRMGWNQNQNQIRSTVSGLEPGEERRTIHKTFVAWVDSGVAWRLHRTGVDDVLGRNANPSWRATVVVRSCGDGSGMTRSRVMRLAGSARYAGTGELLIVNRAACCS